MGVSSKFQQVLRGLLLSCLVLAQVSAFAHELSHDGTGEPELCATCSIGQVLQAGTCSGNDHFYPVETSSPETSPLLAPIHQAPWTTTQARAPPLS